MFIKKLFWMTLLVVLVTPTFFTLIKPGFYPMQDDVQIFRQFEMDRCFKDLQIPCRWIPDGGYQYGYPQFNFYAPLVYYLGEVFHLVGFQFIDVIKILIISGFLLGAIAMFILADEFFGKFPALVASLLYTYAPYKAQEVYVRGAVSEFWASVFFPLVLWASYKLIKERKGKYVFWTSVSLAGLFLTHNLLSFLFIPILLFWALFWLFSQKNTNWKELLSSILLGFGLSAFFLVPMLAERGYVHTETLLGGYFDYRQHFVTLKELFFSNHWGYGSSVLGPIDDLSLSTGIVHWIMGLLAVIFALFHFKKSKRISLLILSLGVIELFILFMMHQRSSFIWSAVPILTWLQFPWRFLSLSILILSFLSAFVISHFGKLGYFLGVLAMVLVLILHASFFTPKAWLNVADEDELTGTLWEKELTVSIFDYLPIYAKFPPDSKAPDTPEILSGIAEFKNYIKGSNYQTGNLSVKEESEIRLPLFDFPGMTVYLNGKMTPHINNNCSKEKFCLGLITFNVPPGDFKFEVKLENTPVRVIGNLISLLAFLGVGFVLIKRNAQIFKK
jgi:uncharacterized membrane protein